MHLALSAREGRCAGVRRSRATGPACEALPSRCRLLNSPVDISPPLVAVHLTAALPSLASSSLELMATLPSNTRACKRSPKCSHATRRSGEARRSGLQCRCPAGGLMLLSAALPLALRPPIAQTSHCALVDSSTAPPDNPWRLPACPAHMRRSWRACVPRMRHCRGSAID